MYSSEKTESRGDSPVIFVVSANVMMVIYDDIDHHHHEHFPYFMHIFAIVPIPPKLTEDDTNAPHEAL